ncbi:MAG: flagellar biosynthetic protein FliR [Deltaproteobacteria bacterium]|nr:flagellar biosynthetic protein FliR [Deltaproteobacteria bacterium]MBN2670554.1 flagellar biosynthetic protein FliR [Deltaproteobacteria bacterium]
MNGIDSVLFVGVLVAMRFFVALRLIPFLNDRSLPFAVCGGLAIALTLFFFPVSAAVYVDSYTSFELVVLAAKEVLVGMILGGAVRACLSVLHTAGGAIGAAAFSSEQGGISSVRTLYWFLVIGVFLLSGGLHAVFLAVAASLQGISVVDLPVSSGSVWAGAGRAVIEVFVSAFTFGVLVAAPVFVAAIISDMLVQIVLRWFKRNESGNHFWGKGMIVQAVLLFFLWESVEILVSFMQRSMARTGHIF